MIYSIAKYVLGSFHWIFQIPILFFAFSVSYYIIKHKIYDKSTFTPISFLIKVYIVWSIIFFLTGIAIRIPGWFIWIELAILGYCLILTIAETKKLGFGIFKFMLYLILGFTLFYIVNLIFSNIILAIIIYIIAKFILKIV